MHHSNSTNKTDITAFYSCQGSALAFNLHEQNPSTTRPVVLPQSLTCPASYRYHSPGTCSSSLLPSSNCRSSCLAPCWSLFSFFSASVSNSISHCQVPEIPGSDFMLCSLLIGFSAFGFSFWSKLALKNKFFLHLSVCLCTHEYQTWVEVRGQSAGVRSLLPDMVPGMNSSTQALWQAPLPWPAKPSHGPQTHT